MGRRAIVGVMGSGNEPHARHAEPLGRWLALEGVDLLTGGGGGVMAAVSRTFSETPGRRGLVIGVLPAGPDPSSPRSGYPNPWVEISIVTHLPIKADGTDERSRNHINVLSSDVIVALAGGEGTASEIALALRYGRPVIAFVDSRADIPGLPPAVPASGTLAAVQEFVRSVLKR
jgi:uncharacterized protein (TIGR00725 family)